MNEHQRSSTQILVFESPQKDWMYSLQLNRWFLKPIGGWPLSLCTSTTEKINSVLLASISTFLIGFLVVHCALCTFLGTEGDLEMKIKMFGPLSFFLMAAIKYYVLISRGDKLGKCIQHVRLDWDKIDINKCVEDREIMIDSARLGRSLAIICGVFMYSGGFFYTAVMPLCAKRVEIIDNQTVRSQTFPIYRGLLDPRTTPSVEIVQFIQFLAGFVMYTVTVSACSLAAVFVLHVCGQFRIVMAKLDDLVDGAKRNNNNATVEERLGDIVEHHLEILGFVTQIEELLHEICLVEVVGCTMNICFLGYYFLTEWEQSEAIGTLTYCTFLVSLTFNIFILCYVGEILSEQCSKIGLMAYMTDWHRLRGKRALGLILIVTIANSCVKLTAGKFITLSLASFCSVVKSAMAYLSLLRTLTE